MIASPAFLERLIRVDRFVQSQLQSPARTRWLNAYLGFRRRIRERLV